MASPDYINQRVSDVTAELIAHGLPLTTPAGPLAIDPNGWLIHNPAIDRTSPAWCTAVRMLADHHHTPLVDQIPTADALLKDRGIRGLATLHRNLAGGAPIDYRFTRCPYCQGLGEDPTEPSCAELGCRVPADISDHPHGCPVCRGANCEPEYYAEQQMNQVEQLLADALTTRTPPRRTVLRSLLRRR